MVGTIIIIVVLILAPVGILLSSSFFVAALTAFLNRDVDITHEGSELLQLSESGSSISTD